jgi:hypothetical protein
VVWCVTDVVAMVVIMERWWLLGGGGGGGEQQRESERHRVSRLYTSHFEGRCSFLGSLLGSPLH